MILIVALWLAVSGQAGWGAKKAGKQPSAIDTYIQEATRRGAEPVFPDPYCR